MLRFTASSSLVSAAGLLLAGAAASAQSLSTGFSGTGVVHSSNPDNGNFFDVTAINPGGITINSLDIHSRAPAGTELFVHVYAKPETYVGFERDQSAWTHIASANTIAAGPLEPTPLSWTGPGIEIQGWQIHGIYVHIVTAGGSVQYFTSAQIPAQEPTNNDARIHLSYGRAINNFFSGTTFVPRGWNGTIYYDVVAPTPIGGCCLPDGSCEDMAEFLCNEADGVYSGDGSACATIPPCPQPPTGACCLPDASCVIDWEGGCLAQWGKYQGDNSECAAVQCPSRITTGFTGATSVNGNYNGNFFDVTALHPGGITIEAWDVHTNAEPGTPVGVQTWYKEGSWVGFHGDASAWTLLGDYQAISAGQGEPTHIAMPVADALTVPHGETYGFRIGISVANLRYHLTAAMVNPLYNDDVQLDFGAAQTNLFTTNLTNNRGWNGTIYYTTGESLCYANCDNSTTEPILTVDDFTCFINRFAEASTLPHEQQIGHYANCDGSTTPPVLTVDDFTCFINAFAAGCP